MRGGLSRGTAALMALPLAALICSEGGVVGARITSGTSLRRRRPVGLYRQAIGTSDTSRAAGRPYPNLVDNMAVARKVGKTAGKQTRKKTAGKKTARKMRAAGKSGGKKTAKKSAAPTARTSTRNGVRARR